MSSLGEIHAAVEDHKRAVVEGHKHSVIVDISRYYSTFALKCAYYTNELVVSTRQMYCT